MKKIYIWIGVLAVITLGVGLFSYSNTEGDSSNLPKEPVKIAPSSPAPSTPNPTVSNTAKLGETISYNGLLITALQVTEDSRCPLDVQCVWAGRVVLSAKLERNGKTGVVIFDSLKENPVTFEGKTISLTKVGPSANYTFTFSSN